MQITVNGETVETGEGASVETLIVQLGLNPKKVAVERNLEIVPKSLYAETALAAGDRIEIVQFVGGG